MDGCSFCDLDGFRSGSDLVRENRWCLFGGRDEGLPGAGIIVPKAHRETVFDLTPEEFAATHDLLVEVRPLLDDRYRPDGYTLGWNTYVAGGQVIPHAHLHVIPRFGDEPLAGKGLRWFLRHPSNRRPDPQAPGRGLRTFATEPPLVGGIANAGQVVRSGPHVLRPSTPHTGSIHAFLRAVRDSGFEGAPEPVGVDEDGRERLVFVEGEVPLMPYPDWSQTDDALASVARLLRGLHEAARGFDASGLGWTESLADPEGGTLVCHNDVAPDNVVFRDGVAVALLDFEFAAPGRPVYDLAHLARLWVPVEDEYDQGRLSWRPADRPARLRVVADAYGLDRDGRAGLLAAMDDAIARVEAAVRRAVAAGDPNTTAMWDRTGGGERYDRRRRWWTAHRDQFAAALL